MLDEWYRLWTWLVADGAGRATAILVFVTAIYAGLTWRMSSAVARQTRALVQPVVRLDFHWSKERLYPAGYFEIKNLGSQPLLTLDIRLSCHIEGRTFQDSFFLWDEHILPPQESLCPQFDFVGDLTKKNPSWSPVNLSYGLEVVVSDLSKQVILTYRSIPVLNIVNIERGMSMAVRWRYFLKYLRYRYHRLKRS